MLKNQVDGESVITPFPPERTLRKLLGLSMLKETSALQKDIWQGAVS